MRIALTLIFALALFASGCKKSGDAESASQTVANTTVSKSSSDPKPTATPTPSPIPLGSRISKISLVVAGSPTSVDDNATANLSLIGNEAITFKLPSEAALGVNDLALMDAFGATIGTRPNGCPDADACSISMSFSSLGLSFGTAKGFFLRANYTNGQARIMTFSVLPTSSSPGVAATPAPTPVGTTRLAGASVYILLPDGSLYSYAASDYQTVTLKKTLTGINVSQPVRITVQLKPADAVGIANWSVAMIANGATQMSTAYTSGGCSNANDCKLTNTVTDPMTVQMQINGPIQFELNVTYQSGEKKAFTVFTAFQR